MGKGVEADFRWVSATPFVCCARRRTACFIVVTDFLCPYTFCLCVGSVSGGRLCIAGRVSGPVMFRSFYCLYSGALACCSCRSVC